MNVWFGLRRGEERGGGARNTEIALARPAPINRNVSFPRPQKVSTVKPTTSQQFATA